MTDITFQSSENIHKIVDVLFFLKTIIVSYMICFFKYLLFTCPDGWLYILVSILGGYCYIDTYVDIDSSGEEEKENNIDVMREKEFLSFMLNINMDKINKYKSSNGDGEYFVRTALVFRNYKNRVTCLVSVANKIAVWCRLFSRWKLYVSDVLKMTNADMDCESDTYLFMIAEEVATGYNYKLLVNLKTKKYIPDYSDVMFSKICIKC